MAEINTRSYASVVPGLRLGLPKALELAAQKESKGKTRSIVFRARQGSIVHIADPKLRKFIEESDAFKKGQIFHVPNEAELAIKQRAEKATAYKQQLANQIADGFVNVAALDLSMLQILAHRVGVSSEEAGKKLTKKALADKILASLPEPEADEFEETTDTEDE